MITKFRAFIESEETPAQAWARMRAGTTGLGDGPPIATYRAGSQPETGTNTTAGASQGVNLPPAIIDLLQTGFKDGGLVSPQLMNMLKLHPDHHMVGSDMLTATPRGPYPFVKEKRAGVPTGRIRFVQHFPIDKFLRILGEK